MTKIMRWFLGVLFLAFLGTCGWVQFVNSATQIHTNMIKDNAVTEPKLSAAVQAKLAEGITPDTAGGTSTDTTNFNGMLGPTDTTVQKALDTLDNTGTGTPGKMVKWTGTSTIGDASNDDTEVADAVTKKHAHSGTVNYIPKWNGTAYVDGTMSDSNSIVKMHPGITNRPFIEFAQAVATIGSVGALGGREMNISYNMDYTSGVHKYYELTDGDTTSNYNALWLTLQTGGLYLQYAPSGLDNTGTNDIWYNSGSHYLWRIDTTGKTTNLGGAVFNGNVNITSGNLKAKLSDSSGTDSIQIQNAYGQNVATIDSAGNIRSSNVQSIYFSAYPPAHSDTYVKATSTANTNYWPYYATDPTKSLTGAAPNNGWVSSAPTNQRFHIDLQSPKIVTRVYYENYHSEGTEPGRGVKTFTLWGSNTDSAFANTTYATDTNWTQLTCSQATFDKHISIDQANPRYIYVTNSTAYRYYAFKFADNYGDSAYMGLRRIELQETSGLLEESTVDTTNVAAAISATTLYTPTVSGMFRLSVSLQITTASDQSSVLGGDTGVTITYTEPDGSVAQNIKPLLTSQAGAVIIPANGNTANTTTTQSQGSAIIYAKAGIPIQYAVGYSSTQTTTAMKYSVHLKLEAL